jgi:hypothetical protein
MSSRAIARTWLSRGFRLTLPRRSRGALDRDRACHSPRSPITPASTARSTRRLGEEDAFGRHRQRELPMPPASTRCLAKHRGTAGPRAAVPDPTHCEPIRDSCTENRRVITREWILEGVTLIFAGVLTATAARVRDDSSTTPTAAYAALLIVTTVISPRTAHRNVHRLPILRGEPRHKRDTPAGRNSGLSTPSTSQPWPTAPEVEHA